MNLKEMYISGSKIYNGRQEILTMEARKEFGDEVADLLRDLPNRVFDAAQNGELELLIHSDPVDDFFTDKSRFSNNVFHSINFSSFHSFGPALKEPLKGTFAQVLHEELKKAGIHFYTYQAKDSDQIETYLFLPGLTRA